MFSVFFFPTTTPEIFLTQLSLSHTYFVILVSAKLKKCTTIHSAMQVNTALRICFLKHFMVFTEHQYFYITNYPPLPTALVLQKDCNAFAEIFRAHSVRIWCADSAQTVRTICARNLHLHYAYNKKLFSGHQYLRNNTRKS